MKIRTIFSKRKIPVSAWLALGVVGPAAAMLWWEPALERFSAAVGGQPTRVPEVDPAPLTGPDQDPLPPGALVRLGRERLRQGGGEGLLAFSPDGKILASVEPPRIDWPGKHTVHLWDVATSKEIRKLEGPSQYFVRDILFSANGKRVSLLGDRFLSTIEVETGKEVHQLRVPWDPGQNPRAVISSDGSTLAWIVQYKSPIHVSDTATGAQICEIAIENYEQPACFADGAKRLTTVSIPDRTVRLREIATGAVVRQFVLPIPEMGGFGKTFSADGKELLAWQNNRAIYVWDVREGREVREIDISSSRDSPAAAISPDGRTVASGSFDGKIRLYDTATGSRIREIHAHAGRLGVLAFSADGKVLASKEAWDGGIQLWEVATGNRLSPSGGHQAGIWTLSMAPDGKTVATVGQDHTIRIWELANGQELRRFPTFAWAVAFSPDGKNLAAGTRPIVLLDAATGNTVRTFANAGLSYRTLVFSPDGTLLAGGGTGRENYLWDTTTAQVLHTFRGAQVWAAAFSADSTTLAMGTNETIELYSLDRAKGSAELRRSDPLRRLGSTKQRGGYSQGFSALAFSPDGKLLAAADGVNGGIVMLRNPPPRDGVIRGYDVTTGQERFVLQGHRRLVTSVQFSPDGKILVSGGEDGTVRVWETATGKELHRFEGHRDTVTCVAFAPDGRTVISGSRDSTALVWDVAPFCKP